MPDRGFREEAARCLEAAKRAKYQNSRAGLVRLAARFLELAGQPRIDFDALLADYNAQQMMPTPSSGSASQQQQRVQPKDDKKDRPPQFGALSDRLSRNFALTLAPSPAAASCLQAPVAERPTALPPDFKGERHGSGKRTFL
jgi:hypothetical protein